MGYTTQFKGILKFPDDMNLDMIRKIKPLLGIDSREHSNAKHEEWTYMQFEITEDMTGIKWDGNEKFYAADAAVNWLTCVMRKVFPEFKFSGKLDAQGEEIGDVWVLKIDEDGHAERLDTPPAGEPIECPNCGETFYYEGKS